MTTLVKVVAWIVAFILFLCVLGYIYMMWGIDKLHNRIGANRKAEKENIVRNVRIDDVED